MLQSMGVFPTAKGEVDVEGFVEYRRLIELQQPLTKELGNIYTLNSY